MEINNIPADYRIRSKRLHVDCVKVGPESSFRTNSKTCNSCYQVYKHNYYRDHHEIMNERAKAYAKARYVPKRKAIPKIVAENVEIVE